MALTVAVIDEAGTVLESWQVEPDRFRQAVREDYGDERTAVMHVSDGVRADEL